MPKPEILQIGSYADRDQTPLDAAYTMHRYFEATDKAAFLAKVRAAGARDCHPGGYGRQCRSDRGLPQS